MELILQQRHWKSHLNMNQLPMILLCKTYNHYYCYQILLLSHNSQCLCNSYLSLRYEKDPELSFGDLPVREAFKKEKCTIFVSFATCSPAHIDLNTALFFSLCPLQMVERMMNLDECRQKSTPWKKYMNLYRYLLISPCRLLTQCVQMHNHSLLRLFR